MEKAFEVSVAQAHIDMGEKAQPAACPVALALKSMGYQNVAVNFHAWIRENGEHYQLSLPDDAHKFIEDFDEGLDVEPLSFHVTSRKIFGQDIVGAIRDKHEDC